MNKYIKPLGAFFSFIIIQLVVTMIVIVPLAIITFAKEAATEGSSSLNPEELMGSMMESSAISITLIFSSIITIFFMQWPMKMLKLEESFKAPNMSFGKIVFLIVASFIGIYSTDILNEIMDLPDFIEAELGNMSGTVLGVLAIAVFGPIAEEVTFRGAIQNYLHKNGCTPFRAIFVTSVLFGLMHMNPAQIPFAMIVGAILGVFYYKTNSLVLPCAIHIINNGMSCLLTNVCPEDFSFVNALGGTAIALCIAIVGLTFCGYTLYKYAIEPNKE